MNLANRRRTFCVATAAVGITLLAPPSGAHHSMAMFDMARSVTLHGTVKEFQWTNPHCFIQLLVAENGTTAEWSIELDAPAILYRRGWRPGTLKAGDEASIAIHPVKYGTKGGAFVSGTLANGMPISPSRAER